LETRLSSLQVRGGLFTCTLPRVGNTPSFRYAETEERGRDTKEVMKNEIAAID
jgi:hypothetical protein